MAGHRPAYVPRPRLLRRRRDARRRSAASRGRIRMILVMGAPEEPMVERVHAELVRRGSEALLVSGHDLPGTVQIGCTPRGGFLRFPDGRRLALEDVRAVYQRLGFHDSET